MASEQFRQLVFARLKPCAEEYRRQELLALARFSTGANARPYLSLHLEGTLAGTPSRLLPPDEAGTARLDRLDSRLAPLGAEFPQVGTEIAMCRLTCTLLEEAWRTRAEGAVPSRETVCACGLCGCLPTPPYRSADDYRWRRSDGPPLVVRPWPRHAELDSVLRGGWNYGRQLNDFDRDMGCRFLFEDDILIFHEYKRIVSVLDMEELTVRTRQRLGRVFHRNSARALVAGLFAAHKRSADEHWLKLHRGGAVTLPQGTPLDRTSYTLLQLLDCLFWHVSPDTELWQEEHLAILVLSRVLDDMPDVRVDALTGEISNFWLADMAGHDKALHAAAAVALVKYSCMPEAHGRMWNTWLMPATIVWMGLTGRHPLWFDGILPSAPSTDGCLLCDLLPTACSTLLTAGTTFGFAARPVSATLGTGLAELSTRCRARCPEVWPLFHDELRAFEALHGPWTGDVDTTWEILRRTYIAAVAASTGNPTTAHALRVQKDAGAVGAELFHRLHHPRTGREDTALLAYMFGCAHPHFLWNAVAHRPASLDGDWIDG